MESIRIVLPSSNHEAMCALVVELAEQGSLVTIGAELDGKDRLFVEGNIVATGHDHLVLRLGRDGFSEWDDHAIDFDDLRFLEVIELR